jgi:hypothetical protein
LADDDRPPSPAAKRVKPGEKRCNEGMVSIAEAKALFAAAASSAEAALYKDLVPQLREDAEARCAEINTATVLSREHELNVGVKTMCLVSIRVELAPGSTAGGLPAYWHRRSFRGSGGQGGAR